jgi:hypothetical protein
MFPLTEKQLSLEVKIKVEYEDKKGIFSCCLGSKFESIQLKICQQIKKQLNSVHFVSNHKIVDSFSNKPIFECTFLFPSLNLKEIQMIQENRINQLKQLLDMDNFRLNFFEQMKQFKFKELDYQVSLRKLPKIQSKIQSRRLVTQKIKEEINQMTKKQKEIEQQYKFQKSKENSQENDFDIMNQSLNQIKSRIVQQNKEYQIQITELKKINSIKEKYNSELHIKKEKLHEIELEIQEQKRKFKSKIISILQNKIPQYNICIPEQDQNILVSEFKEIQEELLIWKQELNKIFPKFMNFEIIFNLIKKY